MAYVENVNVENVFYFRFGHLKGTRFPECPKAVFCVHCGIWGLHKDEFCSRKHSKYRFYWYAVHYHS